MSDGNHINPKKLDWWRPLWRGLVFNAGGKHRKQMGSAIWLYLYLLLHVDGRNGRLSRSLVSISKDMGVPEKTVRKWLKRLQTRDYVTRGRNNGRFCLQVVHYRAFRRKEHPHPVSDSGRKTTQKRTDKLPKIGQSKY